MTIRFDEKLKSTFADEGYVVFEGVIDKERLSELSREIRAEFEYAKEGRLFSGGGTLSGHLNCFPGAASRFVYDTLEQQGVLEVVRALSPAPLRAPNVGCNLNLSGSTDQNEHADGYAANPFLVVNVAAVDTDLTNGAMEILRGTHDRSYKYWEILLERPERIRLAMKQGDVVIRTSALWHRGMSNRSAQPRPMLALTWEDGGNALADPYAVHEGRITFLPNRYQLDWKGRLGEQAFVTAPRMASAFRAVRSLF